MKKTSGILFNVADEKLLKELKKSKEICQKQKKKSFKKMSKKVDINKTIWYIR